MQYGKTPSTFVWPPLMQVTRFWRLNNQNTNTFFMDKLATAGKWLYAAAFFVFGIQHFMYAGFVATLVPAFMPWHLFLAWFVGVAFVAFAASIAIDKYTRLAALLLALMLLLFIVLLHIPRLINTPQDVQFWTRALQDVAIMAIAMALSGQRRLQLPARYLFATALMFLAMQHFAHIKFVTAKVPEWFSGGAIWDYLVGAFIIIAAIGIISNRYGGLPAVTLGIFLVAFGLLYHLPLMIANIYDGQVWTASMLDFAIAGGTFTIANLQARYYKTVALAT